MRNNQSYSYPIDSDWTTEEMTDVINLWRMVELAYETGINKSDFIAVYQKFKKVIPSIGEERQWSREFESVSGYSLYQVVKKVKETESSKIYLDK